MAQTICCFADQIKVIGYLSSEQTEEKGKERKRKIRELLKKEGN